MDKNLLSQNRIFILCLVFSIFALALSYCSQYIWEIEPCRLCKFQRIPWAANLIFSGSALLFSFKKTSLLLAKIACLLSVLLAAWHLLIWGGILSDPCGVPTNIHSLEDFENMLETSPPCTKAALKILGIPISGYNLFFSLFFFFLFLRLRPKTSDTTLNNVSLVFKI